MNNTLPVTQLERLFGVCDSDLDYTILVALCRKSGLIWDCPECHEDNGEGDKVCSYCGNKKPE